MNGVTFEDIKFKNFKIRHFPILPNQKLEILDNDFRELNDHICETSPTFILEIVDTLASEVIRLRNLVYMQERALKEIKVFSNCISMEVDKKLLLVAESEEPRMI